MVMEFCWEAEEKETERVEIAARSQQHANDGVGTQVVTSSSKDRLASFRFRLSLFETVPSGGRYDDYVSATALSG